MISLRNFLGPFAPAVVLVGFSASAQAGPVGLIAERIVPTGGGDLILLSYDSLTDLKTNTNLVQTVLPLGGSLSPDFDIHGLDIQPDAPVTPVPEPATLALMLAGLAGLAAMARAQRRFPKG
jgi:hypothetical protein